MGRQHTDVWTEKDANRVGGEAKSALAKLSAYSPMSRSDVSALLQRTHSHRWFREDPYFSPDFGKRHGDDHWHTFQKEPVLQKEMERYLSNYAGVQIGRGGTYFEDQAWGGFYPVVPGKNIFALWERTLGFIPTGSGAPDMFGGIRTWMGKHMGFRLFAIELKTFWTGNRHIHAQVEYLEILHRLGVHVGIASGPNDLDRLLFHKDRTSLRYRFDTEGRLLRQMPVESGHIWDGLHLRPEAPG